MAAERYGLLCGAQLTKDYSSWAFFCMIVVAVAHILTTARPAILMTSTVRWAELMTSAAPPAELMTSTVRGI